PFAKNRSGIVFGDGASAVVMEDRDSAKARGAHIYAEYVAGGFRVEGGHPVMPDRRNPAYLQAVLEALHRSNLGPENIDVLFPHGVGTGIGDAFEAEVITHVFGKFPKRPPVTAFKGYVGHNLGGS